MKKINLKIGLVLAVLVGMTNSCKEDFLNVTPNGSLDAQVLGTADGVDALLISAYSLLDGIASNGFGWEAASSNWVYGSIRGIEANKGTDSGDQPDINPIQTYSESATNPYLNVKWRSIYDGVARSNAALRVLATAVSNGKVTTAQADSFTKQARTLRGYYHLEAYRIWAKADGTGIPYVDENTDQATLTNDIDVKDLILADLQAGTTLPDNMGQIGRFNGTVAKVLHAKALMQLKKDYAAAKPILESVKTSGKRPNGGAIGLEPKYGDIFDIANRNGVEAIYTVQYSVNDGSGGWNAGWGEVLNFPYKSGASPGGCCGFFQPSHDFVNTFRTTAGGLPLLDDSYNTQPVVNDQGLTPAQPFTEDAGPLDPRLDWSVGRRGIPYLDWGPVTGSDWIRDQSYAGPYVPKKQVYRKSQEGTNTEVGNWTSGYTANGYRLIRYADVLLLLAECQIETNDLAGARTNINLVRARAANPAGFVKESDGTTNAANYVISEYPLAGAPFDSQANARKALQYERKLELGMEGHRYFDLQRWGNVVTELNRVLTYEKTQRSTLYGSATVGAEDVNFPVPQNQIDISNGKLKQNR
ncbi:MAG: RagB/SusD family nutrient uptake outer membrane protein [Cyclobacteriaceae bacterium]|nr:RagB/SusD family nutrient uptake outer membrane protein [Cyclobacteriaceae bacterium]